MRRFGLTVVIATTSALVMMCATSAASSIYLCLTEKAGAAKSGGVEGKCPAPTKTATYAKLALPKEESEQQTLLSILPHIKYIASGVGGKPTIEFSGVNVQIVSASPGMHENELNGAGNLVVGYDESAGTQTGSNNLVLGGEQSFTSYGGIVGGDHNSVSGPFSDAFGHLNTAAGAYSSVGGGQGSDAASESASVGGGVDNIAHGSFASVTGGLKNIAEGEGASISGGYENYTTGATDSISGGFFNEIAGSRSWIGGGRFNKIAFSGALDAIFGGEFIEEFGEVEAKP